MQAAKLSAGLLATGGILGYGGAYWQMASLLIVAGSLCWPASLPLVLLITIIVASNRPMMIYVSCRCP